MNIAFNEVAIAVLKRPLQDCSLDELQQLVIQYPYFGPAHLLLAKKLQDENASSYEEQVQKTSLYFQNRLWLHHLLNDNDTPVIRIDNSPVIDEKPVTIPVEEPTNFVVPDTNEENIELQEGPEEMMEQVVTLPETISMNNEPDVDPVIEKFEEPGSVTETVNENETGSIDPFMKIPSLKIEPLAPGSELSFEPYHTVDYFASQGIKFKEEEKPRDVFSQQLKSFTEWLKAMKRIPASEITGTIDVKNERKIEQLAEHSIAERHVITEAMAEVWEKQGNKAKAEEIYHKLSLLDPSKSSYFAAKIEDLKKTS
jgi:hypothetical protein